VTGTSTAGGGSVTVGFTCLANASDGHFSVPSYILSALPAGGGGVALQNAIFINLPASGLDIGLAAGTISISSPATFK